MQVPSLKVTLNSHMLTSHTYTSGQAGAKVFLCQVLSRAHSASPFKAKEIWQTCISDLQKVAGLDPRLSAIASCSATFLQCQLLIGKVGVVTSHVTSVHRDQQLLYLGRKLTRPISCGSVVLVVRLSCDLYSDVM